MESLSGADAFLLNVSFFCCWETQTTVLFSSYGVNNAKSIEAHWGEEEEACLFVLPWCGG